MSHLVHEGLGPWENYHRTIKLKAVDRWRCNGGRGEFEGATFLAETAAEIGGLMGDKGRAGERLRPTGSEWSFSDILNGADAVLKVATGSRVFRLPDGTTTPDQQARLVLASAGTTVHELNRAIEPRRSLFTSGAHDGQTLAGLLGTGTHGSVLGYGAFQNHVRGVHLVTGPGRSVWLERGPQPILSPDYVRRFAGECLLEPDLFEAALVHLGGLGVVNGVLLDLSDGYMLDFVQCKHVLGREHLELLQSGSYRAFAEAIWPRTEADPYYLQVILNPFRPYRGRAGRRASKALITLMFKQPEFQGLVLAPAGPAEHDPLNLLGEGLRRPKPSKNLIELGEFAFRAVSKAFRVTPASGEEPDRKTWGQANGPHEKQTVMGRDIELYNAAYAIPRERLVETLETMLRGFNESSLTPAVFTLRFVSNADGLLAFTCFPETVVVNLDGAREFPGLAGQCEEAARRVAHALEFDGLAFSQHWGKQGRIGRARFASGFGNPGDLASPAGRWRAARQRLLDADMRRVITSPALEEWGLA